MDEASLIEADTRYLGAVAAQPPSGCPLKCWRVSVCGEEHELEGVSERYDWQIVSGCYRLREMPTLDRASEGCVCCPG